MSGYQKNNYTNRKKKKRGGQPRVGLRVGRITGVLLATSGLLPG